MFPLLLEIPIFGGIRIYTYGVLVALAFLTGIFWTTHEAKIARLNPDTILDLSFYIVLAALVGSRILYIFVDWQRYASHPLDVIKVWEGGLVFYGGLIGAILVSIVYLKRHQLSFLKVADLFMPGVALGHAIGRLGCFAAGCCYGRVLPAGSFFSVTFSPNRFSLAPAGLPLFPSQPVESAAELLIFLSLILLRKKKRCFEGQIFLTYVALYGFSRSILETFRGDSIRGFIIPNLLSTSQLISGCLILIVGFIYFRLRRGTSEGRSVSMKKNQLLLSSLILAILLTLTAQSSCNKAILHSKDREMEPVSRVYSSPVPDALKAAKEALHDLGYKIEREDLPEGTITTGWLSTKATSHYVDLFDRKDYGTVGAYYRLQIRISDKDGKAAVEVSAPVRSVVGRIKSSHSEEGKLLSKMADLLRREDFEMTNVGVEE